MRSHQSQVSLASWCYSKSHNDLLLFVNGIYIFLRDFLPEQIGNHSKGYYDLDSLRSKIIILILGPKSQKRTPKM